MSTDLAGEESEPPPYEECLRPNFTRNSLASQALYQSQLNSYAPVQYNLLGQDPQEFYEVLIDESNQPSEIFCRMADALFFHMDQHCNQLHGTQHIEPAKVAWLRVTLGEDAELSMSVQQHLLSLYDAASIPYTFNNTRMPVLDRRGLLHLCVFEACADPVYAQQKWNKTLNVLKLRDPLTNLPFPTPIPCSAFPSASNPLLNQVYANWQMKAAPQIFHRTSNTMPTQHGVESTGNNVLRTFSTVQVQRAVPIARRSAFQTIQQSDKLQRIQAEKSMQLESSQDVQAQTSKMVRIVEEGDREHNSGLHESPTARVQQAVPIARLAAFQSLQQFERLQTPPAKSTLRQIDTLQNVQKASDTQATPSRVSGASNGEEVDMGRSVDLYKSPTAQVQKAISIARRAAFQTVQQTNRLQNIQPPSG